MRFWNIGSDVIVVVSSLPSALPLALLRHGDVWCQTGSNENNAIASWSRLSRPGGWQNNVQFEFRLFLNIFFPVPRSFRDLYIKSRRTMPSIASILVKVPLFVAIEGFKNDKHAQLKEDNKKHKQNNIAIIKCSRQANVNNRN